MATATNIGPRFFTPPIISSAVKMVGGDRSSHHPSLEVLGGACESFFPAFTTIHRPYNPFPIVGWNRHIETIFASFFRSVPEVKLRRECLRTKDDGSVALDWVSGDDSNLSPDSPTLILLPGLTGGSGDSYVRHMLVRARRKGWRTVVFNSRGCGDSPVTTPQESRSCRLSGAVSLCNPFNLVVADENFQKGFNMVYNKALASSLRKIFKKHALLFEDIGGEFNVPSAANCKTVREFDEGITRVSFGFKSVDDYYSNSSSSDSIKHVSTPLLCIQAENDPIAPAIGIPHEDIRENSNCMLIVTPKGGHLGWVAGDEAPIGAPWTDPVVMDFLEYLEKAKSSTSPRTYATKSEDNTNGAYRLQVQDHTAS